MAEVRGLWASFDSTDRVHVHCALVWTGHKDRLRPGGTQSCPLWLGYARLLLAPDIRDAHAHVLVNAHARKRTSTQVRTHAHMCVHEHTLVCTCAQT